MDTGTAPGLGEIEPENLAGEPSVIELGVTIRLVVVGEMKLAVIDPAPPAAIIVVGFVPEEVRETVPEEDHEANDQPEVGFAVT
jgi:hypothetical protein